MVLLLGPVHYSLFDYHDESIVIAPALSPKGKRDHFPLMMSQVHSTVDYLSAIVGTLGVYPSGHKPCNIFWGSSLS